MRKFYLPVIIVLCAVLFAGIYYWCTIHPEYDLPALMVANGLLAGLSIASFFMLRSKAKAERPQVFVNGVYGATLMRLMVCMGSIFIYLYINKGHLHKPSIFAMMGLYVLYTFVETITASKEMKSNSK